MLPKFSGIENFQAREGELFRVLSSFFISQDRKASPGHHSVLQNFFGRRTYFMGKKRGGGYHEFPRKSFCLPVQIYFIGEQFGVSEKNPLPKKCLIRRGVHHGFVEIFCLTGPKRKSLQRKPSVFQKKSGIEKNDG